MCECVCVYVYNSIEKNILVFFLWNYIVYLQENDVETVKESSEHDMSVKPSQILEWKTLENDDDIWIGLDTLFKGNTGGNIHEDISAISEAQNFLNCNKTISTILGNRKYHYFNTIATQ